MQEIVLIGCLIALVAYWWDTTITNELAIKYCKQLCLSTDVQLLDATVMRQRVWLRRNPGGMLQLCRLYSFEFSGDSESRQYGYIVLLGHEIAEKHMEPYRIH